MDFQTFTFHAKEGTRSVFRAIAVIAHSQIRRWERNVLNIGKVPIARKKNYANSRCQNVRRGRRTHGLTAFIIFWKGVRRPGGKISESEKEVRRKRKKQLPVFRSCFAAYNKIKKVLEANQQWPGSATLTIRLKQLKRTAIETRDRS